MSILKSDVNLIVYCDGFRGKYLVCECMCVFVFMVSGISCMSV